MVSMVATATLHIHIWDTPCGGGNPSFFHERWKEVLHFTQWLKITMWIEINPKVFVIQGLSRGLSPLTATCWLEYLDGGTRHYGRWSLPGLDSLRIWSNSSFKIQSCNTLHISSWLLHHYPRHLNSLWVSVDLKQCGNNTCGLGVLPPIELPRAWWLIAICQVQVDVHTDTLYTPYCQPPQCHSFSYILKP